MKLRSLLHRRHADQVPLLPANEPERTTAKGIAAPRGRRKIVQEERLERLLTPTELDLVREHRV
ncbi:hypothetical protein ACWEO2_08410 [Nocardia sp. NPDC004278]|uniref:hypothetical protein n=1 Tax=unclassified Nocardia TaxID=2637762 RepID=UPI0033A2AE87